MYQRLNAIPPGDGRAWSIYERFCYNLFRRLFYPTCIDKPINQIVSPFPNQRRDIILPIVAVDNFWHYLACVYGGDLVVLECKNYTNQIGQDEVEQTRKYLRRPSVANIAFLISRQGPNQSAFECAMDIYRSENKLIIFLSDKELHQLIECHINHVDAIPTLRRIYQTQKAHV